MQHAASLAEVGLRPRLTERRLELAHDHGGLGDKHLRDCGRGRAGAGRGQVAPAAEALGDWGRTRERTVDDEVWLVALQCLKRVGL